MRASIFVPFFAAAAFAQDQGESSTVDPFPQTTFLQQTNSLGVVTGQPSVATSIPAQPGLVTAQPSGDSDVGIPASIPAVGDGIQTIIIGNPDNSTRTLVVSASNSTTVVLGDNATPSASLTGTGAAGSDVVPTGTDGLPTPTNGEEASQSPTGAANTLKTVAGSLVGAGALIAAFL